MFNHFVEATCRGHIIEEKGRIQTSKHVSEEKHELFWKDFRVFLRPSLRLQKTTLLSTILIYFISKNVLLCKLYFLFKAAGGLLMSPRMRRVKFIYRAHLKTTDVDQVLIKKDEAKSTKNKKKKDMHKKNTFKKK